MLEEDFFTQNKNNSTSIHINVEEAVSRNVLTPWIKKMDSSNSIKSNDIYFIKSSSKFSENFQNENIFDKSDSSSLIGEDSERECGNLLHVENNTYVNLIIIILFFREKQWVLQKF